MLLVDLQCVGRRFFVFANARARARAIIIPHNTRTQRCIKVRQNTQGMRRAGRWREKVRENRMGEGGVRWWRQGASGN